MEKSKFNKVYVENVSNIITEKYHRNLGFWTAKKASKSVASMLKTVIKKEYVNEFNESFVPKKWFNFEKVFKTKPEIEVLSFGASNCKIRLIYSYEMEVDESLKFIYGDSKKGVLLPFLKSPKPGGIIFNDNFRESLIAAGFAEPTPDLDLIDAKILKNFQIIFSFNKIIYVDNVKPSKRLNPNYIKSIQGNIYFVFEEEEEVQIGKCEYFQKRFANMDPPKSLKTQIADMWNKPSSDFGLVGTLLAKGVSASVSGPANLLAGGLFSKTVQEESFDITIDNKYTYSNNIYGGDIDTRNSSSNGDYVETRLSEYFNKIAEELGNDSLIGFDVDKINDSKYSIILNIDNLKLMQILLEVGK